MYFNGTVLYTLFDLFSVGNGIAVRFTWFFSLSLILWLCHEIQSNTKNRLIIFLGILGYFSLLFSD